MTGRREGSAVGIDARVLADVEPFAGFEVTVLVDRTVYAPGDPVRITVTAGALSEAKRAHVVAAVTSSDPDNLIIASLALWTPPLTGSAAETPWPPVALVKTLSGLQKPTHIAHAGDGSGQTDRLTRRPRDPRPA